MIYDVDPNIYGGKNCYRMVGPTVRRKGYHGSRSVRVCSDPCQAASCLSHSLPYLFQPQIE